MHIFRCRSKCNKSHNNCDRGVLPSDFAYCHTAGAALVDSTITFVTFESTEVETFGKGTPYTRMDKIENEMELSEFLLSLKKEFIEFAHHIVAAWFLRSTKLEVFSVSQRRASVLTIVSDFGEAYLVESKHETSDQFFKRKEVNLHGSVGDFMVPKTEDPETLEEYSISFIISSDCKYVAYLFTG